MADDNPDGSGRSPEPATPSSAPANPAEAQFPYVATHGLQPTIPKAPRYRSRRPRGPVRRGLVALLAGLAGVFALAVVAVYLTWGPNPVLGPRSGTAATQTVHRYLQALADRDAATALGYALQPPSDPSLLNEAVLARLRDDTPITDIRVGAPVEPGRVPASYRLGDRQVSTVFQLTLQDDAWRLNQVAAVIDLSGFPVPVQVNGVEPASPLPALFPGRYRVTSAAPRYAIENAGFEIADPSQQPLVRGDLSLSATGRAEVIAAARQHLDDCLRQDELDPDGCGFSITHPDQTPLDESTVSWSVRGSADFTDLDVELDHLGSATAPIDLTVRGKVRGVDGSRWQADVRLSRLRADLTGPAVQIQFG